MLERESCSLEKNQFCFAFFIFSLNHHVMTIASGYIYNLNSYEMLEFIRITPAMIGQPLYHPNIHPTTPLDKIVVNIFIDLVFFSKGQAM